MVAYTLIQKGYTTATSYGLGVAQSLVGFVGANLSGVLTDKIGRRRNVMLGFGVT